MVDESPASVLVSCGKSLPQQPSNPETDDAKPSILYPVLYPWVGAPRSVVGLILDHSTGPGHGHGPKSSAPEVLRDHKGFAIRLAIDELHHW